MKLVSGATKALFGAVYDVTKAVGKLIWLALKTVLSKILDIGKFATKLASKYAPPLLKKAGSGIASMASTTMKSVNSLASNTASSVKGTMKSLKEKATSIGKNENLGWQSEFVQKDDPPYLVSQGDSGDRAREECKPCDLRLQFVFAPTLLDVMVAFNPITTFKVVLSSLPQTSPTLFKCGKACLRYV